MRAVATRYDGRFTPRHQSSPLPAVRFWAIFNEPNFGRDPGPQATNGSSRPAAMYYRSLVAQAWRARQATGHRHNTIVIGELAAKGSQPHGPHPPGTTASCRRATSAGRSTAAPSG